MSVKDTPQESENLLLGIDGGGTKTVAWLATFEPNALPQVIGRAVAGGSNPQSVGFPTARENLRQAIARAFDAASIPRRPVASAVLALAGSDREENRAAIRRWAEEDGWARRFKIVHDAIPVLAAGSEEGWGIALISGTGSLAYGETPDGRTARAGGWGFLFGDEGSAYSIAVAGLREAAKSADGRCPETELLPAFLRHLHLERPEGLVSAIYPMAHNPSAIANLAQVVFATADAGDRTAQDILCDAASHLASLVAAVAKKLGFVQAPFPVALAGGVLTGNERVRGLLASHLAQFDVKLTSCVPVDHPVVGSLRLAQKEATRQGTWPPQA